MVIGGRVSVPSPYIHPMKMSKSRASQQPVTPGQMVEGSRSYRKVLLDFATKILSQTGKDRPVDAILRSTLKNAGPIMPALRRDIAEGVFAYFRWYQWLDRGVELRSQITEALECDRQFQSRPESFDRKELLAKAVPSWLSDVMQVTVEFVQFLQKKPPLWLRARPGLAAQVKDELGECEQLDPQALPDALRYQGAADLYRTPLFQKGKIQLQDLSSQLVGLMANPRPEETWWDACAGEGGKTLHLSDLMGNRGLIWATDRAPWRLDVLRRRAARAGCFNYRARLWDGGPHLPVRTKFDAVLMDAPCSGVGTWHRNPQARWTTSLKDIEELAQVQKRLLKHVLPALKPGGKVIYAVCTLTRAETEGVALEMEGPLQVQPVPLANPLKPFQPAQLRQWFWPQHFQGNGMFVTAWKIAG